MNVLITGTSSGFGKLTAHTLAKQGHTVFASMRGASAKNAAPAAELRAWAEREGVKLHVVELDVTDQASVDAAVKQILSTAGHIDVVVNNAGYGLVGHEETFSPEQAQALFDVNVFGVQRVNRAVLPSMREKGKGLLIHISSGLGRVVLPCMGIYGASKFALEALAESYRYELAPTGVDSVIVQPGAFGTEFSNSLLQAANPERAAGYGAAAKLQEQMFAGIGAMLSGPNAPSPQLVADAVAKLIETPIGQRPLRTVVDPLTGQSTEAINSVAAQIQSVTLESMGIKAFLGPASA
jgi:NAD(P)-dependent dehydrogenase (short-subunit alcohol dehydrogenase family)